ncbi:MAG: type II toxin-antitoxin system VapC family toxin [Coriobacteriia bacterium]|nr:type II toxin-antitoxin system VapC family toxin [Coriobacteriia bacterium]
MNVVDSSAWIEYFSGGPNGSEFAGAIEDAEALIVPSLTIFEVFKRVAAVAGESPALKAVGVMTTGRVVDLSASVALEAARISLENGLAMADSIILATARLEGAILWTQDAHFEGMDGVEFREKRV